jgi:hypothetical protein
VCATNRRERTQKVPSPGLSVATKLYAEAVDQLNRQSAVESFNRYSQEPGSRKPTRSADICGGCCCQERCADAFMNVYDTSCGSATRCLREAPPVSRMQVVRGVLQLRHVDVGGFRELVGEVCRKARMPERVACTTSPRRMNP